MKLHNDQIEIASEQGWGDAEKGRQSRVFLQRQRYEGRVSIVGKNILRRSFDLVIDPADPNRLVTVSPRGFIRFDQVLFRGRLAREELHPRGG